MLDAYLFLMVASLMGMLRGALSLVVEHPLDVIKTYWQAHPSLVSLKVVSKELCRLKGWRGFYAGAVPNLIRVAFKQAYRYPLMLVLPGFYQGIFSSLAAVSIATGLSIAVLEVWLIVPLERFKIWLITFKTANGGVQAFFREARCNLYNVLYRGVLITSIRQIISWVTFLGVHDQLVYLARDMLSSEHLPLFPLLIISVIEGVVNTGVILPIDCIKTNIQKVDANAGRGIWKTMLYIHRRYGLQGFYVGWNVKMVQYIVHSVFTVSFLEGLRERYKEVL